MANSQQPTSYHPPNIERLGCKATFVYSDVGDRAVSTWPLLWAQDIDRLWRLVHSVARLHPAPSDLADPLEQVGDVHEMSAETLRLKSLKSDLFQVFSSELFQMLSSLLY